MPCSPQAFEPPLRRALIEFDIVAEFELHTDWQRQKELSQGELEPVVVAMQAKHLAGKG